MARYGKFLLRSLKSEASSLTRVKLEANVEPGTRRKTDLGHWSIADTVDFARAAQKALEESLDMYGISEEDVPYSGLLAAQGFWPLHTNPHGGDPVRYHVWAASWSIEASSRYWAMSLISAGQ